MTLWIGWRWTTQISTVYRHKYIRVLTGKERVWFFDSLKFDMSCGGIWNWLHSAQNSKLGGGVHHQTIEVFQSQKKIHGYNKRKWRKQAFHTTAFDPRHSCRNPVNLLHTTKSSAPQASVYSQEQIVNRNNCSMIAMWIIMWSNMAWYVIRMIDRWPRISKNLVVGSRPQYHGRDERMTIAERISCWMLIYSHP